MSTCPPATNERLTGRRRIPAVVINLSRHQDRLNWFMANAVRVGLDIERLEAIDASAPCNADAIQAFRGEDAALSPAEAACFLSHRRAWQHLIDSGEEYLAVFEDDAHLATDLPTLLDPALIPVGIELLRLEEPCGKISMTQRAQHAFGGRSIHRVLTRAYGAAGYILSRRCAARLLADTPTCAHPVDVVLFDDQWAMFNDFGVFQVVPAACVQDMNLHRHAPENKRFASEIEQGRLDTKDARKQRDKPEKRQRFRKLRRYLRCIQQGANPFHYRDYVPVDLGSPR